MNIFKKSNEPPAAKSSSLTTSDIISDITAVMKQDDGNDTNNPFFLNHTESWYTELKEYTQVTNDLLDSIEKGADQRDEIIRLKKELQQGVDKIKQKTQEVLLS